MLFRTLRTQVECLQCQVCTWTSSGQIEKVECSGRVPEVQEIFLAWSLLCYNMLRNVVLIYGMRLFCSLNNLSSKIQSTSWAVYVKRCLVWYTAFNQYRSYFLIFQTTIYYTVVYHDLLWLAVIGFIGWCCAIVYDRIPILNSNLLTSRGVDSSDVTKSHDCAITSFQQQSVTPLLWTL